MRLAIFESTGLDKHEKQIIAIISYRKNRNNVKKYLKLTREPCRNP